MRIKTFWKVTSIILSVCMLVSLFTCLAAIPASAETSDLVSFNGTDWSCFKYTKGWATFAAGNYKFTMDCKITSGVPCIQVGADETGAALAAQSNYVETYDSANYKYIITFTMTENWGGNLGAMIGNYGTGNRNSTTGDAVFACANPELYLLDDSGNPTGSSLINTFNSSYYSTSRAGNKWNRRNSAGWTCTSIPDGFFDPPAACAHANTRAVEAVASTCTTPGHAEYTVCADCGEVVSGDASELALDPNVHEAPKDVEAVASTCTTPGHNAYVACSGCGAVLSGDATPLDLDPNNHEGEGTKTVGAVAATEAPGYTGDTVCAGCGAELAKGEVIPALDNKMIHFPAGEDSYQVLVYKIGGTVEAGVYRFTVDEYAKTDVKSTVHFCVNSTAYTTQVGVDSDTLDTETGKRTVQFHLWGTKNDGALLLLGNYGKGSNMETYYRNPQLYLLDDNSNPTGENLVQYFTPDTVTLKTGYSRSNAPVGKWVPINWADSRIILENINPVYFGEPCTHLTTHLVEAIDSTCSTHGHDDYYVCDVCGEIVDGDATLWDLDPDIHEDEVTVPAVASTCATPGHDAYIMCSACGTIISGSDAPLALDPENHTGEDKYIEGYVVPGRTTDGYTGDTYCKGCNALLETGKAISAVPPSTTMLVMGDNTLEYTRAVYRPSVGAFVAGATYTFSMDLELKNTEDEAFFWRIYYRNGKNADNFERIPHASFNITKTELTHGYHYDVTFTVPDDCLDYDNVLLRFGDTGINGYATHMNLGNLRLWKLDGEGNKTDEILLDIPESFSSVIATTDGTFKLYASQGQWYMTKNYTKDVSIVEQEGYFAPIGGYTDCQHENTRVVAAVASTCATPGHEEYTVCRICGQVVSGSDAPLPLDPEKHGNIERRDMVIATRTENGYSGEVYCNDCGEMITEGYVVPAGSMLSKMVVLEEGEAIGYTRITYRPAGGKFISGEKYTLSFDMDTQNTEDESKLWGIYYEDVDGEIKRISYADLEVSKTALSHGNHYEVTFTVPAGAADKANIILKFGDVTIAGVAPAIKLANIDLWQLNGDGAKVLNIECNVPNIFEELYVAGQQENARNTGIDGRWVEIYGYTKGVNVVEQNGYFAPAAGCAHEHTVTIGAVEATTTADGHTGTVYCSDCYAIVTEDQIIPKLAGHTPGDINDDGKVNNKDLTRLFQYLSDWDVEVNEAALDVNGDSKINNKDLTRLFQYLSDWDVQIF